MKNSKTPRRSRLIRKWDGTPVVEEQQMPSETLSTIPSDSDRRPDSPTPTLDFDRENELTDTLER